jgi:hypothetical protein
VNILIESKDDVDGTSGEELSRSSNFFMKSLDEDNDKGRLVNLFE